MSAVSVTFSVPACKREHNLGSYNECRNCDFIKCLTAGCDEDISEQPSGNTEGPFCVLCQDQQAREELAMNAVLAAQTMARFHANYYTTLADNARKANHPTYVVEGWEMLASKYASAAAEVAA